MINNPYVLRELYRADEADRRRADLDRARRAMAVAAAHRSPVSRLMTSVQRVLDGPHTAKRPTTKVAPALRDYPVRSSAR